MPQFWAQLQFARTTDRLTSDAALAALCGVSPVEASSGKTVRHWLIRGDDRQANNALWVIALTSPAHRRRHPRLPPAAHHAGQKHQGDHALPQYLARELYPLLVADLHHAQRRSLT
jgi:transposase